MAHTIAVTNQKGGVGKTTTALNLCAALASSRRRLLLIDLDPQGNATVGCGVAKDELAASMFEVILGEASVEAVRLRLDAFGFDLLPANGDLTAASVRLMELIGRELRLRQALSQCLDAYDYILIDCPPSLSMLTVNALVAANGVLIPMQCEYYALEGLSDLAATIDEIRATVNPGLEIEGLLRTMYDPRNRLAMDVSADLIQHYGDKVYQTSIPRNVRLAEAPSHGLPILQYDRYSRGAIAYMRLAGELLKRREQPGGDGAASTAGPGSAARR